MQKIKTYFWKRLSLDSGRINWRIDCYSRTVAVSAALVFDVGSSSLKVCGLLMVKLDVCHDVCSSWY